MCIYSVSLRPAAKKYFHGIGTTVLKENIKAKRKLTRIKLDSADFWREKYIGPIMKKNYYRAEI
jgi:hypothetical protein